MPASRRTRGPRRADPGGVHLLSFHASKGREWDVVCVVGVAEGLIPRAHRAQGLFDPWALEAGTPVDRAQAQLAEERRTLYVALSRARERLVVSSSPGTRRATPSRFLDEAFGAVPEPIVPGDDARRSPSPKPSRDIAARSLCPTRHDGREGRGRGGARTGSRRRSGQLVVAARLHRRRAAHSDRQAHDVVLAHRPLRQLSAAVRPRVGARSRPGVDLPDEVRLPHPPDLRARRRRRAHDDRRRSASSTRRSSWSTTATTIPNIQFARTYYKAGAKMLNLWWKTERTRGDGRRDRVLVQRSRRRRTHHPRTDRPHHEEPATGSC